MERLELDKDIKPLSEFRAHTASCIRQVQRSKRPVVLTHHGKSAAVLLDVGEYEALLHRIELLEDVERGESQIDAGQGVPHDKALRMVLDRVRK